VLPLWRLPRRRERAEEDAMERVDVERWLEVHPESVHADPRELLDRAEREVRAHAVEEAWLHARSIAAEHLRRYHESFGLPASDDFVANEVCHELARELRRREPSPRSRTSLPSDNVLRALEPPARDRVAQWLDELARTEEHRAWVEVVHLTDQLARRLRHDGELSAELRWDFSHSYPRTAERVTRLLMEQYETHAHGPEWIDDTE
jgi:hypothetical protein